MKRRWNVSVWLGFVVILSALFTYLPVFVRFPATRDFPWATLLLFAAGLTLIARGLARAYREPHLYRGKVVGAILGGLGMALIVFFCLGVFHFARQVPSSAGAPRVGQKAPDFALLDKDGNRVTLSGLLATGAGTPERVNGVVLVFYRGAW